MIAESFDICILGGGPAGSALACRLAQMGHSVLIVEKALFPRAHIGESLTPGVLPLLDVIGVRQRVEEANFLRPNRAKVYWPPHRGFKSAGPVPGFQVLRSDFDDILLRAAEGAGVSVLQGATAARIAREERDSGWRLEVVSQDRRISVCCAFLVDATGRSAVLGGRRIPFGEPTLALWSYWKNCRIEGPETLVEAGEEEWFWGAPLPDGSFNATVFVDASRARVGEPHRSRLEKLYLDLLKRSHLLAPCARADRVTAFQICDATCSYSELPFEDALLRVGEASFTIDPLSSQGVQASMGSALHAAAVIHTVLKRPHNGGVAATFYRQRQQESVEFHCTAAAGLYAQVAAERGGAFWRSRADEGLPRLTQTPEKQTSRWRSEIRITLASTTQVVETPCLTGDFIEMQPAICDSRLPRPIAFLDQIPVGTMLSFLRQPASIGTVLNKWSSIIGRDQAERIMDYLWEIGLIVPEAILVKKSMPTLRLQSLRFE